MQPYVLLGLEIQSRGHEVVLATEARMEGLVQQIGKGLLGFHCISGDPTGMLWEKKYQVCMWVCYEWVFMEVGQHMGCWKCARGAVAAWHVHGRITKFDGSKDAMHTTLLCAASTPAQVPFRPILHPSLTRTACTCARPCVSDDIVIDHHVHCLCFTGPPGQGQHPASHEGHKAAQQALPDTGATRVAFLQWEGTSWAKEQLCEGSKGSSSLGLLGTHTYCLFSRPAVATGLRPATCTSLTAAALQYICSNARFISHTPPALPTHPPTHPPHLDAAFRCWMTLQLPVKVLP